MAHTLLTDLELPTSFAADVLNRAVELSGFFNSGIIENVTGQMDVLPSSGFANMPFWNDLSGDSQVAHAGVTLTINAVDQGLDRAAVLSRGKAFGAHDLSAAFKGEDPIGFIAERFAEYWAREFDRIAAQNVKAAMATTVSGASMAANVLDISALSGDADLIDAEAMIDATQLLGELKTQLTGIAMHSAVEAYLAKQDLIDYRADSEGKPDLPFYMGKRVVVSDRLAAVSSVYPVYFFGPGAVGFATGTPKVPSETYREPLSDGGREALIQRQLFAMHPRGIKFSGSPAGETATDAELATASNWSRVWTAKNIRIAVLKGDIA